MFHYTYWLEDELGKAYIGSRTSSSLPELDPYMGSSSTIDEALNKGIKFKKIILATWPSRKDVLSHEILLHDIFNVDKNPKFYNKAKQTSTKFVCSTLGMKHNPEVIELFKKQKLGKNNPNFGKRGVEASAYGHIHTPEQREKMKNFGPKNGMYGKNHKEESIQKMKENRSSAFGIDNPFYGNKHKEESKRYGKNNHMYGIPRELHPRARKVNTPFGVFNSVLDAADNLNIHPETIRNRIKSQSEQFNQYFYIGK